MMAALLALCTSTYGWAQKTVSVEDAQKVAKTVAKGFKANGRITTMGEPTLSLVYTAAKSGSGKMKTASVNDEVYYYIFNVNQNQGFVIVTGNDVATPVLGYSDKGSWDSDNLPPNLEWWMSEYVREIQWALDKKLKPDSKTQKEWTDYKNGTVPLEKTTTSSTMKTMAYTAGTHLIQTQWNQTPPYNNLTPSDTKPDPTYILRNGKSYTGCVATAMAQMLKYWADNSHRAQVVRTIPNYYTDKRGFYLAPIPPNNWNDIWNNLQSTNTNTFTSSDTGASADAVAQLMLACGVSVYMDYDQLDKNSNVEGSGAFSYRVPNAFRYFFNTCASRWYERNNPHSYSPFTWDNFLRNEISNGRPVYYAGSVTRSPTSGRHAFVCEGYDSTDKFYFNFGWGGTDDGWFPTKAINTSNGNFNYRQVIVTLDPTCQPPDPPTNLKVEAITCNSVQLSWSAATGATATSYMLEYKPSSILAVSESEWTTVTTAQAAYTPNDLAAGITYNWRVTALNGCNSATVGGPAFSLSLPNCNITTFEPFGGAGSSLTSIAVDQNKNVWAGTDKQGIFFLNQKTGESDFRSQNIGADHPLASLGIQSLASDKSGNIWVAQVGTGSSTSIFDHVSQGGGMERIDVGSLQVQHLAPDTDAEGMTISTSITVRDGLGTANPQQVVVDANNKVWVAQKCDYLTAANILVPGTFSYRAADDYSARFTSASTWTDYKGGREDPNFPYPQSTNSQSRDCYAISTDKNYVYICVGAYVSRSNISFPSRILQYTLDGAFVNSYPASAAFPNGGTFNAVYGNSKGVWATLVVVGNGFSVLKKDGTWTNIKDPKIVPPSTVFKAKAIWGDDYGRVYLGTNNGLIVYNGTGAIDDPDSYTLYTKAAYDSPNSKYCPEMVSNTIIAGTEEGDKSPYYSWIATDAGVMRGFFPPTGVQLYHVEEKKSAQQETYNSQNNYTIMTTLSGLDMPGQNVPSFAADGTTSSVFRYEVGKGGAHSFYDSDSLFSFRISKNGVYVDNSSDPNLSARYGKLSLKKLENYQGVDKDSDGKASLDDLDYVDVIYKHPSYIDGGDLVAGTNYAKYNLVIVKKDNPASLPDSIFSHPIKFTLPPVLLCHEVWSDIRSMQNVENFLVSSGGYSPFEVLKAWRTDQYLAENPYGKDAGVISEYINDLRKDALGNLESVGKVNVIAHGRGGLYARAYIENIDPNYAYNDDINSLITLNTPHFGSQLTNAAMDQRFITGKISTPQLANPVASPIVLDDISYSTDSSFKIGDIFQMVASLSADETKDMWGAKNLMVQEDPLSGSYNAQTHFIEDLNSDSNLQKLANAKVPLHAVSTTFKTCEYSPDLCSNGAIQTISNGSNIPETDRFSGALGLAFKIITPAIGSSTPDDVMKSIFDKDNDEFNGDNDFVVPKTSATANLSSQFIDDFQGVNIAHSDLNDLLYQGYVTNSDTVNVRLLELLRENVNSNTSHFTKNGIPAAPKLTYSFLRGLATSSNTKNLTKLSDEDTGKILIDPNSFVSLGYDSPDLYSTGTAKFDIHAKNLEDVTSDLHSGENAQFDVYQKNLDEIVIACDYPDVGYMNLGTRDSLGYKNTFSFHIPEEFAGKFSVTAYGFSKGQLVSMHTVEPTVKIPEDVTLQSIRFENSVDSMPEQSSYTFNLLGLFTDGIERRINGLAGVTYTIDDPRILEKTDSVTLRSLIPGTATLTASVDSLAASLTMIVEEDPSLLENIITDFYPEYEKTGPIKLTWDTFQEYQSKNFTLERSENDDQNFTLINQQPAKGTYYNPSSYSFSDDTNSNHVFYRLKLYNLDNQEVYSQTIEVDRTTLSTNDVIPVTKENKLVLAPNPLRTSTGSLFLKSDFNDNQATLNIYDFNGRLVYTKKCAITIGEQKISFEIPGGARNGVYLVQLKTKNYTKSVKLMLQR